MTLKVKAKLVSLLLLSMPLSTVHADTAFDSFYTGISVGQSLTTANVNFDVAAQVVVPAVLNASASTYLLQTLKKNAPAASVFAGYGFSYDPFYFGGEFSFKKTNANASATNAAAFTVAGTNTFNVVSTTSVQLRSVEFALDARPGIVLTCNSLLYARVGVTRNELTLKTVQNLTAAATGFPQATFPIPQTNARNVTGLRLGGGLEQKIDQYLSLRLDYIYTHYQRMQINNAASIAVGGGGSASLSNSTNVKAINHSFLLGLSYFW